VIARDVGKRMVLYRVNGPLRQVSQISGVYGDSWSGPEVTYTRYDCHDGGTLTVQLQSDPNLFTAPNLVTASSGEHAAVPVTGTTTLTVPLTTVDGRCVVRFQVAHTAVPAVVLGGPNQDTRALGVHFNRFTYRP
jgi:hypothetical protein